MVNESVSLKQIRSVVSFTVHRLTGTGLITLTFTEMSHRNKKPMELILNHSIP